MGQVMSVQNLHEHGDKMDCVLPATTVNITALHISKTQYKHKNQWFLPQKIFYVLQVTESVFVLWFSTHRQRNIIKHFTKLSLWDDYVSCSTCTWLYIHEKINTYCVSEWINKFHLNTATAKVTTIRSNFFQVNGCRLHILHTKTKSHQ